MGRLIAVVGPSGVGKDSLMAALAAARPGLHPVRRWITRPAEAGGEPHFALTVPEFEAKAAAGAFCLHWRAHGLHYGIPCDVLERVQRGEDALANLSRGALGDAARVFPAMTVLNITASADVLHRRLAGRGRESVDEIAARLTRAASIPDGLDVADIDNNGTLEAAVAQALDALYPVKV